MSESVMYIFPADPRQAKPHWPVLRAQLLRRSFIREPRGDVVLSLPERFEPGPLFYALSAMSDDQRYRSELTAISFEDHGEKIVIHAGENIVDPPGIPDSDRVVEDWMEFAGRWIEDPTEKWIDLETGRSYGLLDLDWEDTLAAGKCMLVIRSPEYLFGRKAVTLLCELTGQPFRYSLSHL